MKDSDVGVAALIEIVRNRFVGTVTEDGSQNRCVTTSLKKPDAVQWAEYCQIVSGVSASAVISPCKTEPLDLANKYIVSGHRSPLFELRSVPAALGLHLL